MDAIINNLKSSPMPFNLSAVGNAFHISHSELLGYLTTITKNDENSESTRIWRSAISRWDNGLGSWIGDTEERTLQRRKLVIEILGMNVEIFNEWLLRFPINEPAINTSVIARERKAEDWVADHTFPADGFWHSYRTLLKEGKEWEKDSLDALDIITSRIINFTANPNGSAALHGSKGLVVGYVQSGKTANFTGVVAKAADAGYKLIIILSGRTEILRQQTQERLDKELLGWEALSESEKQEIKSDTSKDENEYVHYSKNGTALDKMFLRLTTPKNDVADRSERRPSNYPTIAVMKKVPARLKKIAEMINLESWKKIPILVIDDEADEASVNTGKGEAGELKAIAKGIADILAVSEYSQYIGYTATPYANVFIRPDFNKELFPSDFVITLDRPTDYMGALDFFDISVDEINPTLGNEAAHIRPIPEHLMIASLDDPASYDPMLEKAMDAFVLSGAIKHWRSQTHGTKFKHHTMLINTDRTISGHDEMALIVEALWKERYPSSKPKESTLLDLKALWETDFRPVSESRGGSVPTTWETVLEYIHMILDKKIRKEPIKVNCDKMNDTPDFSEKNNYIWAILIGGSKLSRGYTVADLTVTYFSRNPGQLDTLVQMARWYGYRKGYQDLVRLYLPEFLWNQKTLAKKRAGKRGLQAEPYPLLDAFRFSARVEEAFRDNLEDYSRSIKPEDILPLVQYSFDDFPEKLSKRLKPTSISKMRHARLQVLSIGGKSKTLTKIGGTDHREHNEKALVKLLESTAFGLKKVNLVFGTKSFSVLNGITSTKDYIQFMNAIVYSTDTEFIPPVIAEQISALEKMDLRSWRIVAFFPQTSGRAGTAVGMYELPTWTRQAIIDESSCYYNSPGDPEQTEICEWLAEFENNGNKKRRLDLTNPDTFTSGLRSKDHGVLNLIPFKRENESDLFFLWKASYPGKGRITAYQVSDHR